MTEKKQNAWDKYIKPNIQLGVLVTMAIAGINYYVDKEKEADQIQSKIPESPEEMIEIRNHINEVPSDVENYKREIRLIQQGDSLLDQQKEINENLKIIDSFYVFEKKKAYSDSIAEAKRQESRDKRTSEIEETKKDVRRIENAVQLILSNQERILDTIN